MGLNQVNISSGVGRTAAVTQGRPFMNKERRTAWDRGGTKRRLIIDKEIDQVNYIKYNGSQGSHLWKRHVQEEKKDN